MARSGGRPTAYRPEYAEQAFRLALLGATDQEVADFFGVAVRTVQTWKQRHPEFLHSLKKGKLDADASVADSLFQRALGYEWDEAQPIKLKTVLYENGKRVSETERVEIVTVRRVVPPDPTSMIFWLKNRRPQNWRDKIGDGEGETPQDAARRVKEALAQMEQADGIRPAA